MALLARPADAADGDSAKKIQERLMAPCCWSESVAVHRSETAAEMRVEIARMVAGGSSEEQIIETYVGRYGERILMEPRGAKQWWLTVIPIVLTLTAVAGLLEFLRRLRRRPAVEPAIIDAQSLPDVDPD